MAELATIARPYAEALFKASQDDLRATQDWLDALAVAASSQELLQFAASPKTNAVQVQHVVGSVLREPLPPRGVNFLRAVVDNERLAALPEIARQFRQLANGVQGSADVVIDSAFPLDDGELADLVRTLERRFGQRLKPRVRIDPSLIGGVRVAVGDEVLDTSVRARLEQMKMALTA